jgi:hypothetical protein
VSLESRWQNRSRERSCRGTREVAGDHNPPDLQSAAEGGAETSATRVASVTALIIAHMQHHPCCNNTTTHHVIFCSQSSSVSAERGAHESGESRHTVARIPQSNTGDPIRTAATQRNDSDAAVECKSRLSVSKASTRHTTSQPQRAQMPRCHQRNTQRPTPAGT